MGPPTPSTEVAKLILHLHHVLTIRYRAHTYFSSTGRPRLEAWASFASIARQWVVLLALAINYKNYVKYTTISRYRRGGAIVSSPTTLCLPRYPQRRHHSRHHHRLCGDNWCGLHFQATPSAVTSRTPPPRVCAYGRGHRVVRSLFSEDGRPPVLSARSSARRRLPARPRVATL
jgi:hypothetical protein